MYFLLKSLDKGGLGVKYNEITTFQQNIPYLCPICVCTVLFEVFVSSKGVGVEVARHLTENKGTLIKIDAQRRLIDQARRRDTTQRPADIGPNLMRTY